MLQKIAWNHHKKAKKNKFGPHNNFYLDQIITFETPKFGPDNNFTTYIYIHTCAGGSDLRPFFWDPLCPICAPLVGPICALLILFVFSMFLFFFGGSAPSVLSVELGPHKNTLLWGLPLEVEHQRKGMGLWSLSHIRTLLWALSVEFEPQKTLLWVEPLELDPHKNQDQEAHLFYCMVPYSEA